MSRMEKYYKKGKKGRSRMTAGSLLRAGSSTLEFERGPGPLPEVLRYTYTYSYLIKTERINPLNFKLEKILRLRN
jgi:hypothetical protein